MMHGLVILLAALILCSTTHALPQTMKGVLQPAPHEALVLSTDLDIPVPRSREVLIRVVYAAVNRMDLVQAKGLYAVPPGASPILGVEVSGVIESIGPDCELGLQQGDNVMALLEGGGYAEYAVCDERTVVKLLPGVDLVTSSAVPEAFMTAYQLLFFVAKMIPGESVLIHAAASSVGQAAIQLAARKGITVIATTRSADKLATCLDLGAHYGHVVETETEFSDFVLNVTEGKGVDVVLDPVGSSYLQNNIRATSVDGRLVLYGLLSGGTVSDDINNNSPSGFFRQILFKRISILPSTLRSRSYDYKASLIKHLMEDADAGFRAISSGGIEVHVSEVFRLEQVKEAHALMAENKNVGKIVITVGSSGREEL